MKNKFILRRHTAVTAALETNDPASWTIERGLGVLSRVAISEIKNPVAEAKTASVDAPSQNGEPDLTEAVGGVFYKNKKVEITFQTLSDFRQWFGDLRGAFTALHGQTVDFAFATALDVQWYYTGRLSVDSIDEPAGKLTIKIDAYPFLQSTVLRRWRIPTAEKLDRSASGWSVSAKAASATVTFRQNRIIVFGNPGDRVVLRRTASAGRLYAFAVNDLLGGRYVFPTNGSRTLGQPASGALTMQLTLDGSYYDWTTENGESVYKPCMVLDYLLTELTPDADGKPIGAADMETTPRNAVTLAANTRHRPELYNYGTGAADVLLDGTRIYVPVSGDYSEGGIYPEAVLPGLYADRDGTETLCVLSAVGNAADDEPDVEIRLREERLG